MKILFFFLLFSIACVWGQEEQFVKETLVKETFVKETFVKETFVKEIISSSGLDIQDTKVDILDFDDFERKYKGKYDIDWGHVMSRFGVGASIIVLTGTVSIVSALWGPKSVAMVAFASFKGAAEGCISGAVVGVSLGKIRAYLEDNPEAAMKYAIEDAAKSCMWGAIFSVGSVIKKARDAKKLKKIADSKPIKSKPNYNEEKGCIMGANGNCSRGSRYAGKRYPLEEKNPELARKYPNSVKFDENANPIFDPYAKATVHFEDPIAVCGQNRQCFAECVKSKRCLGGFSQSGSTDFLAANEKMGYPGKYPPNICGPKGNEPCTWHHKDTQTLQLVPRDLHSKIPHNGGASQTRQLDFN